MERYLPEKLLVEGSAANLPLTRTIIKRLDGVPLEYVRGVNPGFLDVTGDEQTNGQNTLLLAVNKGRFFEPCPGTKHYLCCMYTILNFASNCHLNCTYCILQAYLNNPYMVFYTNTDDMLKELDKTFDGHLNSLFRVGTGENTDSLILDHLTSFTRLIVPYFANKPNGFLELKTKTDSIENLEGLEHVGKRLSPGLSMLNLWSEVRKSTPVPLSPVSGLLLNVSSGDIKWDSTLTLLSTTRVGKRTTKKL